MKPSLAFACQCELGENPLWHPTEERLYWTDAGAGELYRANPENGNVERCYEGEPVGGFTVQNDGNLLLFRFDSIVTWARDGTTRTVRTDVPDGGRFNDVIADPSGRVFCGTVHDGDRPGGLYRLETDATLSPVVDGIGGSNGLGFSPDCSHLYYTDTVAREIYRFDYNRATGELSNRTIFAQIDPATDAGKPDGLAVDADGDVWSARWNGSCLVRYRPDGTERTRYRFPVRKVTSVTFGGPDYETAYVTTARRNIGAVDPDPEPDAGSVFRLDSVGKGTAPYRSGLQ